MLSAYRRSLLFVAAALALPLIVFVILQTLNSLDRQRSDVEAAALSRAEQIDALADARVQSDFAAIQVLATSSSIVTENWAAARARAREIVAINPHWRNVVISDPVSGAEIFTLRANADGAAVIPAALRSDIALIEPRVSGVFRTGADCPCLYLQAPVRTRRGASFLLSVVLDPEAFQQLLLSRMPEGAIAAIVDRDAMFIARSLDFEERTGTRATEFVQGAVQSEEAQGIYRGRTFEGFENFTAFHRSAQTGWSTHVAVASSLVTRPQVYSTATLIVGSLLVLAIAGFLIVISLRQLHRAREIDEQRAQSEKLEALGRLTGGVAHDFNNLLAVMIGAMTMLLKRTEDARSRWIIENALDTAQKGSRLTKQLLAFSRHQKVDLVPIDVHQLLDGARALLNRSVNDGVDIQFALDADARWMVGDPVQIELAILNLVLNARDAMPDGGVVSIAASPAKSKPGFVELSVTDQGSGIPKALLDRVVEPFYTTKPGGTGLGLAQVYGAVRQCGGSVEIESQTGEGTTVRLFLPRADAPVVSEAPAPAPSPPPHSQPLALVVDDEAGIRSFIAEVLSENGYDVAEADSAATALEILQTRAPDLLVTDYAMPGETGLMLAERARGLHPSIKVLLVSGNVDLAALQASALDLSLLPKPFDDIALMAKLGEILKA